MDWLFNTKTHLIMGRFFLGGKGLNIGGHPVEYNNGTLSFTVSGDTFPKSYYVSGAPFTDTRFIFESSESNTATIDYGDGSIITYTFKSNKLEFRPNIFSGDATRQAIYTYTDGNSGNRVIRISFGKIDKITKFQSNYCMLKASFPNEIGAVSNLAALDISLSEFTSFPPSFATLKKLITINVINIGTAISQRIPDEFNNLKLNRFSASSSIDLGDGSASNLMGFLASPERSHLQFLFIDGCKLIRLPTEIENCANLYQLHIGGQNLYELVPPAVNLIPSLEVLGIGEYYSNNVEVKYWCSLSNLINLRVLDCQKAFNMETNLPPDLQNCVKLKNYQFSGVYRTNARINAFITNFYNFIDTYASKTGANTLPYRGVTMDCSYTAPSGTFQSPTGYVAGSNNGTPASPKEMLWVLVNQYGHTITYTA